LYASLLVCVGVEQCFLTLLGHLPLGQTYVVSLLADLCEHGAPHEDMEEESALCTRLVKGVLQPMIDDHEVSAQCTRVIVAVAGKALNIPSVPTQDHPHNHPILIAQSRILYGFFTKC
jgi:hypothetical protein